MVNTYTVQLTVTVAADTESEAYKFIRNAIDRSRQAEIVIVDQEVVGVAPEND